MAGPARSRCRRGSSSWRSQRTSRRARTCRAPRRPAVGGPGAATDRSLDGASTDPALRDACCRFTGRSAGWRCERARAPSAGTIAPAGGSTIPRTGSTGPFVPRLHWPSDWPGRLDPQERVGERVARPASSAAARARGRAGCTSPAGPRGGRRAASTGPARCGWCRRRSGSWGRRWPRFAAYHSSVEVPGRTRSCRRSARGVVLAAAVVVVAEPPAALGGVVARRRCTGRSRSPYFSDARSCGSSRR